VTPADLEDFVLRFAELRKKYGNFVCYIGKA
jgi:hypothetical protein